VTGRPPFWRAPRGLVVVALLAAVAAALAGCGGGKTARSASPAPAPTWFAPCAAPTGGSVPGGLPRVSLPCFTGGASIKLDRGYGKPTVINLWASWCPPCRQELPHVQAYADRAAGKVAVLTVDVQDTRSAGRSFAQDAGVRLPTLYDQRGALLRGVGRSALPVTLLLDASGRLVYTYNAQALTVTALDALVAQHLHVTA
jgi:cytochrome c biogenesis protein CcmG/thiol:disulfide interchange protein DsbE